MTMLIKQRRSWELPESAATSESVYINRREWLKAHGFAPADDVLQRALGRIAEVVASLR